MVTEYISARRAMTGREPWAVTLRRMEEWCLDNIGIGSEEWDYYQEDQCFIFFNSLDATAFRLRFGL